MTKKLRGRNFLQMGAAGISAWLIFIADTSITSACLFFWHEPDCPEELLK